MTADQLRECREDFMEWFRTTSPQTLDFTLQSTIREFAYQAWKDATIKANTRPTAVASHAEGVVAADDPQTDREALVYLMQAFDTESWQCPRCGHDEDCATMDSAYFLRDYLRDHPPRSGDEERDVAHDEPFGWVSPTCRAPEHGCTFATIYSKGYMELVGDTPRIPLYTRPARSVSDVMAIRACKALLDSLVEFEGVVDGELFNHAYDAIDAAMAARGDDK